MWFGLELAAMGMAVVFTFLVLLIMVTSLMSKLVGYIDVADAAQENTQVAQAVGNTHTLNNELSDDVLIQVISAAIQKHRFGHHKCQVPKVK